MGEPDLRSTSYIPPLVAAPLALSLSVQRYVKRDVAATVMSDTISLCFTHIVGRVALVPSDQAFRPLNSLRFLLGLASGPCRTIARRTRVPLYNPCFALYCTISVLKMYRMMWQYGENKTVRRPHYIQKSSGQLQLQHRSPVLQGSGIYGRTRLTVASAYCKLTSVDRSCLSVLCYHFLLSRKPKWIRRGRATLRTHFRLPCSIDCVIEDSEAAFCSGSAPLAYSIPSRQHIEASISGLGC